ncbi:cytochrome C554 [candidate division KSB1 bacterium]|nr:cytochrome C554 [candidate division KSB1 bacterium]
MKKVFVRITIATIGIVFFTLALFAEGKKPQYIGAGKCKMCHKSEKKGNQYGKWLQGPHSKAYKILASEKSIEIAKVKGIAVHPQKSEECLICHVTGYKAPAVEKTESFSQEEGVGCEACHGPGSVYKSLKIMKSLASGEHNPIEVGFNQGDEQTCISCHNEKSPTFKPFDFTHEWTKISHSMIE